MGMQLRRNLSRAMCLIVIVGLPGSGADLLAEHVSSRLGYRLVERDAVIKRAATWGIPDSQLREAAWAKSPPLGWLRPCSESFEMIAIRTALAAEAAVSESVFSGLEGLLLPRRILPILRIRFVVPVDHRVMWLARERELRLSVARSRLRQLDRIYRDIIRRLSGLDESNPVLYDLVVDVPDGELQSATETIAALVADRQKQLIAECDYRATMSTFALESHIAAALRFIPSTAHLRVLVRCDHRLAFVATERWTPSDRAIVQALVPVLTGLNRAECVEFGRRRPGMLQAYKERKLDRWVAWASAGAVCCLVGVLLMSQSLHRPSPVEVTITGLVTDTRCAGSHIVNHRPERSPCARYCVSVRNLAEYALYDGNSIYVLHDQNVGASFAARTVTVKGRVDDKTNVLYVRSITPEDRVD